VIDDYVADTGPMLARSFGCLYGQAAAICLGSGIVAFRAGGAAFVRGVMEGIVGSAYFALILLILGALLSGDLDYSVFIFVLTFGAAAAVVGAAGGLILRGP
jgi:hypothetical protein